MSTYYSLHDHIIFSTKNRATWIKDNWISRFHQYIEGVPKGLDAVPFKIGGVTDHSHLLLGCKTTHRLSDLVREIKKSATAWVHCEIGFEPFCWQVGYAVFSVSPDVWNGLRDQRHDSATHSESEENLFRFRGWRCADPRLPSKNPYRGKNGTASRSVST